MPTHSSVPCEIWYKKLFWIGPYTEKWHTRTQKRLKTPSKSTKNAVFQNLPPGYDRWDLFDARNVLFSQSQPKLGKTGFFTKMAKFNKEKGKNANPTNWVLNKNPFGISHRLSRHRLAGKEYSNSPDQIECWEFKISKKVEFHTDYLSTG